MLLGFIAALVYIVDARRYQVCFDSSFYSYSFSVTDGIVFQFGLGLLLGVLFLLVSVVEYRESLLKGVQSRRRIDRRIQRSSQRLQHWVGSGSFRSHLSLLGRPIILFSTNMRTIHCINLFCIVFMNPQLVEASL